MTRAELRIERAAIADVLLISPSGVGDARGAFVETFRASALAPFGVTHGWTQENQVRTALRGVVRGLHFQAPPHAQAKLVRVLRGAVFDVAVDLRRASATYGRHVATELSAESGAQVYIPAGFAHGYQTLTDDCEILYKTSAEYAPHSEGGLRWSDPALAIAWPLAAACSARDAHWPDFSAFASPFA